MFGQFIKRFLIKYNYSGVIHIYEDILDATE